MISETGRAGRGFTLLELLIVLAILAMFAGYFLLRFDDSEAEEMLTRTAAGIQGLALKAKKRSDAFKRDQYIVFSSGSVLLSDSSIGRGGGDAANLIVDSVEIPSVLRMEVRTKDGNRWQKLNEMVWTFRDSGLSDPLSLRFSHGRSYAVLDFNVLTARAEEEIFLE